MVNVISCLMSHVSRPACLARPVACLMALAVLPAVAARTAPSVPKPPVVTYGLIRDEYGVPLAAEAKAEARLVKAEGGDKVYALSAVEANVYLGMNYRLSLEIDSSGPERSRAVTVGTPMRVQAVVEGVDEGLSPEPTWATPAAGTMQRRDYTLGEDADGDGLPDAWELWMMELNPNAGEDGAPNDLAAFRPGDDCDGDGMTNLQEFLAGTDPFLATDLFSIVSFEPVSGTSLAAITFKTSVDRLYHVLVSDAPGGADWSPVATATSPEGAFGYETYAGTGRKMTVYVDAALGSSFFKVACH